MLPCDHLSRVAHARAYSSDIGYLRLFRTPCTSGHRGSTAAEPTGPGRESTLDSGPRRAGFDTPSRRGVRRALAVAWLNFIERGTRDARGRAARSRRCPPRRRLRLGSLCRVVRTGNIGNDDFSKLAHKNLSLRPRTVCSSPRFMSIPFSPLQHAPHIYTHTRTSRHSHV